MLVEGRNRDHRSINIAASKRQTDSLHIKKIRCGGHCYAHLRLLQQNLPQPDSCTRSKPRTDLLNDLISPRKQRGRHIEPEGLRGLQVDHQLVFGRRLHREIGGPGSDMPQQHALASFWRAWGYATRQDTLFLLFHHRFSSRHYVVFGFVDAVFR
jgi:hypothetical protein